MTVRFIGETSFSNCSKFSFCSNKNAPGVVGAVAGGGSRVQQVSVCPTRTLPAHPGRERLRGEVSQLILFTFRGRNVVECLGLCCDE